MTATVECRVCQYAGSVVISKRNWPKRRPAVTGVPCPKCGKHKLRKIRSVVLPSDDGKATYRMIL